MLKQKPGIISLIGTSLPLLLLTGNSAIAANLIKNGSFEIGPDPGDYINLPAGSTDGNWVVTDDDIDYIGTLWQAADGQRSLDLDGLQPGAIAQTFNTTVGQSYLVTFDLAGNPAGLPAIKTMKVSAGGQSADFTFDVTGKSFSNMGWTPQSWQFTAITPQTTLEFSSLTNGTFNGPALDNVVVETVPEPVTILGSLTLLAFGTVIKRQKAR